MNRTSSAALVPAPNPAPAILSLVQHVDALLAGISVQQRAAKAGDALRYQTTLIAFTTAIAKIALSRIPPRDGLTVSFRKGSYIGSEISLTALRKIRDGMYALGLIVVGNGFHDRNNPSQSYATRIRHTGEFARLVKEHGLTLHLFASPPGDVIAIRDHDGSPMPADVAASAKVLRDYNDFIGGHDLTLPDQAWHDLLKLVIKGGTNGKGEKLHRGYCESRIYLTRRFAETYERGGRLYDGFWQNMPKVIRSQLLIDGQTTVELDFSRIHPTLLFADKGRALDRDPYVVPGYNIPTEGAKVTFNRLLNARRKIQFRSKEDAPWFQSAEAFNAYRDAMIEHLSPIAGSFQSDQGARLQKKDSDLVLAIIQQCLSSNIPVYPVHDSFIVRECDKSYVESVMISHFKHIFGQVCGVKCS